jgi:cytochrome c oxidase subunit III
MATTAVPGFRSPAEARRGLAAHRAKTGGEGMEPGLVGLMLFIASEVMFFAGLFGAYFTFRANAAVWPLPAINGNPIERLKIPYAVALTVILVTSSFTMQGAIWAIRQDRRRASNSLIALTLVLGATFVTMQGIEWFRLDFSIKDGIYPSLFYTITGFHGLHVIGGLLALSFLLWRGVKGSFSAERHVMIESVSFYWHFVDVVWLGVFSTLYLLH